MANARLKFFLLSLALGCGTGCGSAASDETSVGGAGGAPATGGTGGTAMEECGTAGPAGEGQFTEALLMRNRAPVFRDLDAACDGSALYVGTMLGAAQILELQIVDSRGMETDVSETLDI